MSTSKAYRDGYEYGADMHALAGNPNRASVDQRALLRIAKRWARAEGYRDLDSGIEWVQGFIDGYTGQRVERFIDAATDSAESEGD